MSVVRFVAAFAIVVAVDAASETFVRSSVELRTGPHPESLASGDINGDGIPDIVTADRGTLRDPSEEKPGNDQLSIYLSSEAMVYVPQPQLRTGFGPYSVVLANVDALKALDIVAVSFIASRNRDLSLFRNLGETLFETHYFSVNDDHVRYRRLRDGQNNPVFTRPGLTSVLVRDFDGDGLRDAIATAWSSDVLAFFPGDIDTYFGEAILIDLPGAPRDICTGDFDSDGKADIAVALSQSNEIALLSLDENGSLTERARFASRGTEPSQIVCTDVDADGLADLVVGHARTEDSIVLFRSDGDFSFRLSQEFTLGETRERTEVGIRDLVAGDFNEDGWQDLAVAGSISERVHVLINRGSKTFPRTYDIETYRFREAQPLAIVTDDFNRDRKPDLAVSLGGDDRVRFLLGN